MKRIALALAAFATLATTGCAAMSTRRPGGGAQITRTTEQTNPLDNGAPGARPDLGQR